MYVSGGRIAFGRFDTQMVMIVHQAISGAEPAKPIITFSQSVKEQTSILIIEKSHRPCVATRSDMMDGTGKF